MISLDPSTETREEEEMAKVFREHGDILDAWEMGANTCAASGFNQRASGRIGVEEIGGKGGKGWRIAIAKAH